MAKWSGAIGYSVQEETSPGVWEDKITEHVYSGDLIRNTRRMSGSQDINADLTISNEISILSDQFTLTHIQNIRYVECLGCKWSPSNIEVNHPRLKITLGGLYNG